MKKRFKTLCFLSLALVLLFAALMIASALSAETYPSGSIGIIGGSDGPTAMFLTQTLLFANPLFWALCFATGLFIVSAIAWLITANK